MPPSEDPVVDTGEDAAAPFDAREPLGTDCVADQRFINRGKIAQGGLDLISGKVCVVVVVKHPGPVGRYGKEDFSGRLVQTALFETGSVGIALGNFYHAVEGAHGMAVHPVA